MIAAIYARYSGDRQREASNEDQIRVGESWAAREKIKVGYYYQDKAITGAVRARPDYLKLLDDAARGLFQILIVHDLSRLSRDDYELKGVLRKLIFIGIRIIGVADGYDSDRKGHKIHAGFKGLMNELHLDDIRAWTHKGMAGKAEDGFNCGGRTYGYRNIPIEDPTGKKDAYNRPAIIAVRYEIDETQAAVVKQIHEWYAAGYSYKWIAHELNRQRIPSSRNTTWAISAIKVILENEMYEGILIWNRRNWVKHPETGKRTYKERPKEEWIIKENPELRIVPPDTIEPVRLRQKKNSNIYQTNTLSAQRYLFSGIMVCAECGGNFVISGKDRYGCASNKCRGPEVCSNGVTVSRHIVEERLLRGIKEQLASPGNFEKFKRGAVRVLEEHKNTDQSEMLQRQLKDATRERDNILTAIKAGIITPTTKTALESAEGAMQDIERRLKETATISVSGILPKAMERYQQAIEGLNNEFGKHMPQARDIIKSLVGEKIRIHRRGDHLEAELQDNSTAILAKCMNYTFDSFGCGGRI